jgi:hypothetical protein
MSRDPFAAVLDDEVERARRQLVRAADALPEPERAAGLDAIAADGLFGIRCTETRLGSIPSTPLTPEAFRDGWERYVEGLRRNQR